MRWLLAGLLAACGAGSPEVRPHLDAPPAGDVNDPFAGVDHVVLAVERLGGDSPIVQMTIPAAGPFSLGGVPFGDDLVITMSGRDLRGVELAAGRTCPISVGPDSGTLEPHLFFAHIIAWTPAFPSTGAGAISGYAPPDGSAVFASAAGGLERFDPLTGEVLSLGAVTPRAGGLLTDLGDGRALLAAGRAGEGGELLATVDVVDPFAVAARRVSSFDGGPAVVDAVAFSPAAEEVLVCGGRGASGLPSHDVWRLRLGADGTLDVRARPGALARSRAGHSATALSDEIGAGVLLIGGRDDAEAAVAASEVYWPLFDRFEELAGTTLEIPRWGHRSLRLPGGWIIVVGGWTSSPAGAPVLVPEIELYDPASSRFVVAGRLPEACGGAGVSDFSLGALPDGRALLVGGRDGCGQLVATALILDLAVDGSVGVTPARSLASPRAGAALVRLCDESILVSGGADAPVERYRSP